MGKILEQARKVDRGRRRRRGTDGLRNVQLEGENVFVVQGENCAVCKIPVDVNLRLMLER